jgi:hypothetical protein
MIFSIAVSRRRVRAIFALGLTGLRLCFYTKIEWRSFRTVWTHKRHPRAFGESGSAPIG